MAPLAALAVVVAIGAAGATTKTSHAADDFVFTGRGFGHGVGMSQYGAYGRAQAGWSAARILGHYYPGTTLQAVPGRTIRVLLSPGHRHLYASSSGTWQAVGRPVGGGGARIALTPGRSHRLTLDDGDRVVVSEGSRRLATFRGTVRLESTVRGGAVAWGPQRPDGARRYRGALRIAAHRGSLEVVNTVDLEDYLRGVVPREMPPSWADRGATALVAQAVAARSYALATLRRGERFNVYDDTRSQVYGGVAAEDARTNRAIAQTRNTVLTHDGTVITAYFFSTSGGRTEDVQNAWPGSDARPYLVSVADPFDRISPYHSWPSPVRVSPARLGTLLRVGAPVARFEIIERGQSPRVKRVRVTTTKGRVAELSGADVRARLGLRDTWFSVTGGTS